MHSKSSIFVIHGGMTTHTTHVSRRMLTAPRSEEFPTMRTLIPVPPLHSSPSEKTSGNFAASRTRSVMSRCPATGSSGFNRYNCSLTASPLPQAPNPATYVRDATLRQLPYRRFGLVWIPIPINKPSSPSTHPWISQTIQTDTEVRGRLAKRRQASWSRMTVAGPEGGY